jgi:hypothetical protein
MSESLLYSKAEDIILSRDCIHPKEEGLNHLSKKIHAIDAKE